jgi:hypothetical protein
MTARDLTAEDIADWLTPRQAVEILEKAFKSNFLAKHALLERLRGGMVQAVSGDSADKSGKIQRASELPGEAAPAPNVFDSAKQPIPRV